MISQTNGQIKYRKGHYPKEYVLDDLVKNHNHAWIDEIIERNKNNLDKPALLFRNNYITYKEYFMYSEQYAKALRKSGVKKGDVFVAMVRQTPDYPILFGAASLIGAVVNFVNPGFDKDYIAELILASDAEIVFVNDWDFAKVAYSLRKSCLEKKIIILETERWDVYKNPYKAITDRFFVFDKAEFLSEKSTFSNVESIDEFLKKGDEYTGEIREKVGLDDDAVICYTSGSTKVGIHKGVPLKNRTYIIMGRYHDPEVTGLPSMKNIVTLSSIDTQADVTLLSGLSDTMMQGGTMALDPIIHKDYFLYSLYINKVQMGVATRTFWISAMKEYYQKEAENKMILPFLYAPIEGGEPLSSGEEKALNKWLKDVKAGTAITHTPFSITKMSIGGGDTENGNIFVQLFRDYKNVLQRIKGRKEPIGLSVYNYASVKALREDGTYCAPMEIGHLVVQSPLAMDGYYNCKEDSVKPTIIDAAGVEWRDLGNYGYLDEKGYVYLKGRISADDPEIKTFEVNDVIAQDARNIMSCETVYVDGKYVIHLETQINKSVETDAVIKQSIRRLRKTFGNKLNGKVYFRVRSYDEGFPIAYTTKRNVLGLKQEGISNKVIQGC